MARSIDRTKKLKTTITDLENALASWDGSTIANGRSEHDLGATSPFEKVYSGSGFNGPHPGAFAAVSTEPSNGGSLGRGLPTEVRKRTLDLLNQLKVQIDELSSEDQST